MADNYLEKKFEEHQAKKTAPRRAFRPAAPKAGTLSVKFPPRRVFVTGGAHGIGRAIVGAFCNAGCKVAFCDCDEKAGQATAEALGAQFLPADVADAAALERCMERIFRNWGDIDILVNNAGISAFKPLTETDTDDFDKVISTNLRPAFITARCLARHRRGLPLPNGYGRIINICSTRYLMSEPGTECYAASKGGIYALTHALAMSLADLHITVNSISPGWIQTEDYGLLKASDHRQHPSRRVGRPEDIARMCLFICQPENDFIDGENITIDGGMTKKMIYED